MKNMEQKSLPGFRITGPKNKVFTNDFYTLLVNSSLSETNKRDIEYITQYFYKHHDPKISSRSFIFYGQPGIGKTFLAEKILQSLNVEILYMANYTIPLGHAIHCTKTPDLLRRANNPRPQIIYIDDVEMIQASRWSEEPAEVEDADRFMEILELIKRNPSKLLLMTMNDINQLDEQMMDRVEVKIHFDLPSTEHKLWYLIKEYGDYLSKQMREFVSKNTIGYNFRDLPELIKLAYRMGNQHITMGSLKKALSTYRPTQLYGFDVFNAVDTTLKNIIGKPQAMKIINRVVSEYKYETLKNQIGIKRGNILLFHGPPGTGKSFMARALAGEIGFPLISIQMRNLFRGSPFESIEMIIDMGKRYRHCVILIDEADKFLGHDHFMDEDSSILGELHRCLDGVDAQEVQSIFILAANDVTRFGKTLLDRFVLVPFTLPTLEERESYVQGKMKQVRRQVKDTFQCHDLALRTEGMSYREMDRIWNDLMFLSLENPSKSSEELLTKALQLSSENSSGGMMFG